MNSNQFELTNGKSSVIMTSLGGFITKLKLEGVMIFNTVLRGDTKQAATHPCTPNFGPETTTSYGLPQHGPMRNSVVEIGKTDNSIVARYEIEAGTYPKGLTIIQTAKLTEKSFSLETIHLNSAGEPLPLNFGEHCYWDSPEGWEGITVNGTDITQAVKTNDVIELKEKNEIQIPGKPLITLCQSGLPLAMCWSYGSEKDGFDTNYVCIEPIQGNPKDNFFGSEASLLAPSSSITHTLTISIS